MVSQTKSQHSPTEKDNLTPNIIPNDDSMVPLTIHATSPNERNAPTMIPCNDSEHITQSPRVGSQQSDPVSVQALLNPSSLPKNARFRNTAEYSYLLRSGSKPNLILQHMRTNPTEENIANCIFNPTHSANRIYKDDRMKETIDSLLAGPSKDIWERSLSDD